MNGSPPGTINTADLTSSLITAAMTGLATFIAYVIASPTIAGDLGMYGPILVVSLTFLQKLVQKWISNNQTPTPPGPTPTPTPDDGRPHILS